MAEKLLVNLYLKFPTIFAWTNQSFQEPSNDLCMDKSIVSRTMSLFFASGNVKKKPYP